VYLVLGLALALVVAGLGTRTRRESQCIWQDTDRGGELERILTPAGIGQLYEKCCAATAGLSTRAKTKWSAATVVTRMAPFFSNLQEKRGLGAPLQECVIEGSEPLPRVRAASANGFVFGTQRKYFSPGRPSK